METQLVLTLSKKTTIILLTIKVMGNVFWMWNDNTLFKKVHEMEENSDVAYSSEAMEVKWPCSEHSVTLKNYCTCVQSEARCFTIVVY